VGDIATATAWITGVAMALGTIYFLWSGFAKRTLTIGYACGALGMSALLLATGVFGLGGGGEIEPYWLSIAILMIMLLAPWSLGRVRHA
jgi:hypothetical protein